MQTSSAALMIASAALLGACNTVRGVSADMNSVVAAFDPNIKYATCGSYGPIDRNNDGRISSSEWNDYRAAGYTYWDSNGDGRISRAEYANCWYGGGFYTNYNRAAWEPSYTVFDTNRDGYLSPIEYWNAQAYASYDRNRDGVLDSSEWPW